MSELPKSLSPGLQGASDFKHHVHEPKVRTIE